MKANILVNTLNMDHSEWLKWRRNGIGGSDAAAIAGLNPWKSAVAVYMDKIGESEPAEDNERMRIGRDLEEYVAKRFEEATGMKVRRRNAILQHPKYHFMLANVDRLIVGKNEGLECKTTNSYAKKEWEGNDIPIHYEIQCHHYMAVTGYKAWWIACLIGNEKFVYKRIERDEEVIKNLIEIEKSFWKNHVIPRQMPAPDGSDAASEIIKEMYPNSYPEHAIELPKSYENKLQRLDEIRKLINKLDKEKKQLEQEIQLEMGENEIAIIGDRKITWKTIHSNRFDSKRFKQDYPDIYEKYIKNNSYRKFQIK
jgi:putative phage-type endonuclease